MSEKTQEERIEVIIKLISTFVSILVSFICRPFIDVSIKRTSQEGFCWVENKKKLKTNKKRF